MVRCTYNKEPDTMDPTTALSELLDALEQKDTWRILDALDVLQTWITGGGFIPELPAPVRDSLAAR